MGRREREREGGFGGKLEQRGGEAKGRMRAKEDSVGKRGRVGCCIERGWRGGGRGREGDTAEEKRRRSDEK